MNLAPVLLALSLLAGPVSAWPLPRAAENTSESTDHAGAQLTFPLLDLPYNTQEGIRTPSMEQSLAVTSSFYEATHLTLEKAFGERKKLGRTAVALFDLFSTAGLALPFSEVWLHEEFHRAVLGNRGMDSFNDVYEFRPFADAISASHVRDEDLIRLKRDHPADQVRLNAAGSEGEQASCSGWRNSVSSAARGPGTRPFTFWSKLARTATSRPASTTRSTAIQTR